MGEKKSIEITVSMAIDVDGAPNAYGPKGKKALDNELNAHAGAKKSGAIVGYLTKQDGKTPVVQGSKDPCPGFYISTSAYVDKSNPRVDDPRRYVNAAEINYMLWATASKKAGVQLGDFCTVHSLRTLRTVYAIVGDSGNRSGREGSLALLQRLGYKAKDGRSDGEDEKKIVIRYFAGTNPKKLFFFHQADLEKEAAGPESGYGFFEISRRQSRQTHARCSFRSSGLELNEVPTVKISAEFKHISTFRGLASIDARKKSKRQAPLEKKTSGVCVILHSSTSC